jgi:hypothetical protein
MNSIKIEMGAILSLKFTILKHRLMHDYINSNDKEPSWDGFIYLYKSDDLKAEDIVRIPVQVKGKNQQDILNRQSINYQVEYKHLRNYYHDGGVFYIVVVISDDGEKTSIFYNPLTTIKLANLLKGTENKMPDQTKNICLLRLDKNNSDTLYKLLAQFGMDRDKQGNGNGEIIKKAINISVINQVDSITATSYSAKSETDILKQIATGEISLYGHRADIDMWLPFDYSLQKGIVFKRFIEMNKPIGIDGVNYYDCYFVEGMPHKEDEPIIRVSENLTIDLFNGKFNFDVNGDISSLLKDVKFLKAVKKGKSFYFDNRKITDFNNVKIPKKFKDEMKMILDLSDAFMEIGFNCNKKFDEFTNENWKYINELLKIHNREIRPKEGSDNAWYMWYWDNKVVPIFLCYNEEGKIDVINWFTTKNHGLYVEKDKHYNLPRFFLFKRDVLEKLYDVDKNIWIEEIERIEYSENIIQEIYQNFVDLVATYDMTQNDTYYDVALLMIDKALEILPEDEYGIINKMQLLKRKRKLTNEEIQKLEEIEEKSDNPMTKCAVNILIENKRKAQKLISELPEENQKEIMGYPIYNLLL